jgi:hypothetical protein
MSEQRMIAAFYQQDHDRLAGLFWTFQQSKRSDLPRAREAFEEFKARTRSSLRRLGGLSSPLTRAMLTSSAAAYPATHSVSPHHEEAKKHHRYHDEGEDPPETGPSKPSTCKHMG